MLPSTSVSPQKKLKSPILDAAVNTKTSITCSNVPDALFDTSAAKKHFSKFGRVQRIRLLPKRQMCVIEYEQPIYAERALLNAGAYDGFMFDVTRTKPRVRRKSKRDDDPDWVPDSDVEDELSAMSGAPTYSLRSPKMDVETPASQPKPKSPQVFKRVIKTQPRKSLTVREKPSVVSQPASGIESPVSVVTTQTSLSTMEAAAELVQLRSKVSLSPDEQWRTLDARDRILRSWGGAGSRVKVGGATIGTCPDMCPEKELLHRQSEYQLMTLESVPGVDGQPEIRAVKQYSRSSADQEIPMCYELRPASVLMSTCAYLLHEIADTKRQVTLADWFHFMWDRLRGIRKDIAQQALCCSESIILVEMCARFHAHCAARLADLEHTQFDQKLNTDNLTKCLQTLKHMYADVTPEMKPREAEFRGYIALLNLGDANFWWEIKQLPDEIQKSPSITFAIKIFNALDNNNYVRFFRLITEGATYLQACILLRYFNDVRARALARIVKAYAPRGGSRYPIVDLMNALAFESEVSAISFVNHYGLRSSKIDDCEPAVVLDRNQFIEDSDPYPLARAVDLIESKRVGTVAEVIAGGQLPKADFYNHVNYTSFTKDGKLKETALVAEDQGYNTVNDTNKVLQALKSEIQRLMKSGKKTVLTEKHIPPRATLFKEPETKRLAPKDTTVTQNEIETGKRLFAFTPAIPVAPAEEIKHLPPINFGEHSKNMFSFSKPQETFESNNLFLEKMKKAPGSISGAEVQSIFSFSKPQETHGSTNLFSTSKPEPKSVFGKPSESKGLFESKTLFKNEKSEDRVFKQPDVSKPLFGQSIETKQGNKSNSVFGNVTQNNLFSKPDDNVDGKSMFANKGLFSKANSDNLFAKPDTSVKPQNSNIFTKSVPEPGNNNTKQPSNIFGAFSKLPEASSIFGKSETMNGQTTGQTQSIFAPNGEINSKLSPSSLFKSAVNPVNGPEPKTYTVFQSKNKAQSVADNILHSINNSSNDSPYEFKINQSEEHLNEQYLNEQRKKEEEMFLLEQLRKEEERKQILLLQEEERRKAKADELRKREVLKQLEAKRREEERQLEARRKAEEERKQEELRKKLEEEKKAEIKRREEEDRKFKQRVDNESVQTIEELINEVNHETVQVIMKEKVQEFQNMLKCAGDFTEEIIGELCNEMCCSEIKAEKFLTKKLMQKWYHIWRLQYFRNRKRRNLLEDTPVWLPENNTLQEACRLRRPVEPAALRNMNAIHRGYRFKGELRLLPSPEPYNIMEIIRSSLLKRMRQINYLYDKCFFWKVTIVSPGENKWLFRRINTEKWIMDAFSDKKDHEASQSLIHVSKQSWNHLMDFAISVSLISKSAQMDCGEAIEGSNGVLIYSTEQDYDIVGTIKNTLQCKYPYQIIPITVLLPKMEDTNVHNAVDALLKSYVQENYIAGFKIYMVDSKILPESLNACTKSALKWMARNCPRNPPLEIDYLKSLCQRYLGNEIWCQLKSEQDVRMQFVLKDLHKLVACYNTAVDKLTEVITEEDLFNYSPFPLEFKMYLDDTSPYPKPHEFIPSSVNNSENTSTIRNVMQMLKLPSVPSHFNPLSVNNIQDQMRTYCNQIGWFENPEEVVCKVVAVSSNELSDFNLSREDFTKFMEQYNFIDFLNIIVYEKISKLKNISNQFAIYKKNVLDEYRNINWLYETKMLSEIKHKPFVYEEDELDYLIEAKRRKIAMDSMEYLMLEDKDSTIVEENIKATNESITKYNDCEEAVKQLEQQLEVEKMKSMEFENMLKAALSNC